ncbi:MAG: hypothetical protein RL368_2130 [Pseudomonadota bacterium]|jgi:hypothetical protein
MKTLLLEIDDRDYATILAFTKLLPETHCRVLEEDMLSEEEQHHIQACLTQIQQGDYSKFDDWEQAK